MNYKMFFFLLLTAPLIRPADAPKDVVATNHAQAETCAICLDDMQAGQHLRRGICGAPAYNHKFHKECINAWLLNEANQDRCPTCRQQFSKPSTIHLLRKKIAQNAEVIDTIDMIGIVCGAVWCNTNKCPNIVQTLFFTRVAALFYRRPESIEALIEAAISTNLPEQAKLGVELTSSTLSAMSIITALSCAGNSAKSITKMRTRTLIKATAAGLACAGLAMTTKKLAQTTKTIINSDFRKMYKLGLGSIGIGCTILSGASCAAALLLAATQIAEIE